MPAASSAYLRLRSCVAAVALVAAMPAFAQSPAPAAPAAAPSAAAPATPDPSTVVARVNGEPVTEADIAIAAEDPALALPGTDPKQKRDILIGYAIDLKLGSEAARAAKIDESPEFQRRLGYLRDKLLVDEYLEEQTKKAVSPEAARALYDETVKNLPPEEEVRARHILVGTEDAAKAVLARLRAGEDFAKVAAEVSTDPGSKAEGGELGFFTKDRMVAPFAEAAFALKPNELSEPVKSQFGWHIIQPEERRTKPVPPFAEMKDQIEQYLTRKAQQDAVLALRRGGKVERVGEAATPPGASGAPAPGGAASANPAPAPTPAR